jgi:hypothetical protein
MNRRDFLKLSIALPITIATRGRLAASGKIIWLFSDSYSSDMQAPKYLRGMRPVYAWAASQFGMPGKLTWAQASSLIASGYENHNHGIEHVKWAGLPDEQIVAYMSSSWKWWQQNVPGGTATKILGPPYTSSARVKELAMAGGEDWGPFQYTMSNNLEPADSLCLPPGYQYRWQTAYCYQGTAPMLEDMDWAASDSRNVLVAAFHALRPKPTRNGGHTLISDFIALVDRAKSIGLEDVNIMGLGDVV